MTTLDRRHAQGQSVDDSCQGSIDTGELRQVLGAFVTGVTVITALDDKGTPFGLTANSFSSVSLQPPLILWSQSTTAPSHPVFRDAHRFAVNILSEDQVDVSRRFSSSGVDKFALTATHRGLGGVPAYLECVQEASFPGGDHAVFLGRVERIERHPRRSLVFGGGRYLIAQAHEWSESPRNIVSQSQVQLRAVRIATAVLGDLARDLNETLALAVWGNHGPTVIRWEQPKKPMDANLRTGVVSRMLSSATGLAFSAFVESPLRDSLIDTSWRLHPVWKAAHAVAKSWHRYSTRYGSVEWRGSWARRISPVPTAPASTPFVHRSSIAKVTSCLV